MNIGKALLVFTVGTVVLAALASGCGKDTGQAGGGDANMDVDKRLADLQSPDTQTRLAAAEAFAGWRRDKRVNAALRAAAAKEKDQKVKFALNVAIAGTQPL